MSELIDVIAQGDHVILPVERLEPAADTAGRLDLRGWGRPCRVTRRPLFHQLLGTESCSWNTTVAERETEMLIRIDVLTPTAFRLQMVRSADRLDRRTPMIASDIRESFPLEIEERDNALTLRTGKITIRVDCSPYRLTVLDDSGQTVTELGGFERTNTRQWDALPTGFVMNGDGASVCEHFRFAHDEELLGLGERFLGMRCRGRTVRNWCRDGKGNHTPRTHKPIPFFVSTRGYGIFLNTSVPFTAWMGSQSAYEASVLIEEDVLDYYFFYGPGLADVVSQYTALTGRAAMPPKWSFGLWMSRDSYRSDSEALGVAQRLRKEKIPCDVIHLDPPWMGSNGTFCTFAPAPEWGDFEGTIRKLHELHFRVSFWQMPFISERSPDFEDGMRHGALVETWAPTDPPVRTGVIDFSSPAGISWYKSKIEKILRLGADVVKVDFGETAPPGLDYHGYSGRQMHNLYGLLYDRAAWEITEAVKGAANAVIWSRPGYAGSQRYPVHWSGDPHARFETLACVHKAGLSLSLAGFSFWANDLGGYFDTPSPELYTRWTQLAFFCSHVRSHGGTPREPWEFGDEALANFRKYVNLRYSLLPYILEEAEFAAENGLPFIRPLVLDYQTDRTTHFIDDQYLFGRSILVAPVLTDGARARPVYLPAGEWLDFWTKATLTGPGWIDCDAPLDHLPLFTKAGASIRRAAPAQYIADA